MFSITKSASRTSAQSDAATVTALDRVMAVIAFTPDGTILSANDNFCKAMGYSADQIRGHHHRMFLTPADAASPDYRRLWDRLHVDQRDQQDCRQYRDVDG